MRLEPTPGSGDRVVRVLHIIAHMEKGGAERQMCLLTESSRHHHVIAVLAGNERPSSTDTVLLPDLAFFQTIKRVRQAIRDHQIDVVHTWVPERLTVPATIAAKLEGCPVLAGDRRKPRGYGYYMVRDRLYYVPYLLADVIVPNYPIVPKRFSLARALGFRRKTTAIPNGIGRVGSPDPITQIPDRILFVGRLVEQKRVSMLINSLAALRDGAGITGLDIVGDGPDRTGLEAMAADQGVADLVTFHGARFDWHSAFSPSTHLVALPSASEGMSNTVFEAMDHGFFPLVSDSPELRQLLAEFSEQPGFFPLDDSDAFVEAVKAIKNNGLEELRRRIDALRAGLDAYSIPAMAERYDALYGQLLTR